MTGRPVEELKRSEPRLPKLTRPDGLDTAPKALELRVRVDPIEVPWYVGIGRRLAVVGRILLLALSKTGGTAGGIAAGILAILKEFNIAEIEGDDMIDLADEHGPTDPNPATTDAGKKGVYSLIAFGLLWVLEAFGLTVPVELTQDLAADGIKFLQLIALAIFGRFFFKQAKDSKDSEAAVT